jgi:hypothetical protein
MPPELKSEFFSRFLRGRLQPLANHHSANFVVQAWMAACCTPQQVCGFVCFSDSWNSGFVFPISRSQLHAFDCYIVNVCRRCRR